MTATGYKEGDDGTNSGDLLIQLDNVGDNDTFHLMSTAGAMNVFVSLDGTNYSTAALALTDQGATSSDPVLATTANRIYGFRGKYRHIQIKQVGVTAVTDPTLSYGSM